MTRPPSMTEQEADAILTSDRTNVAALVAKGDIRFEAGDRRGALAFYEAATRAAAQIQATSSPDANHAAAMATRIQQGIPQHIVDTLATAGHAAGDWHPRFRQSIAIMLGQRPRDPVYERFPQMPTAYFYPGLPYVEFADRKDFACCEAIEAETEAIRAEAEQLASEAALGAYVKGTGDRPQGDVHGLLENDDWSTLDLTNKGVPDEERVARYPRAFATISGNAPLCDITNRAPSVMFSRLAPKAKIPPHTGMINARFICHLPLVIPGNGALRVGTQSRPWQMGEVMIFDDTVEHEAWNDNDTERLVLIFDIWRPELEEIEKAQIRALFHAVDTY